MRSLSHRTALIARARSVLEDRRRRAESLSTRREAEIYARFPRIREIDLELRRQMTELFGVSIGGGEKAAQHVAHIEAENLRLQKERADILRGRGYASDYTDVQHSCALCKDSGRYENAHCTCLKEIIAQEINKELSGLLRYGDESFESFNLSLYPNERDTAGNTAREQMSVVFDICKSYADNFGKNSPSLLFRGGTGLGKTFLSACIARVLAGKGFTVGYESATAAFEAFEAQKFSRDSEEAGEADERVEHFLDCDLFILDDLGTEMQNSFFTSALYTIVNTRLTRGKKTIISTNMSVDDMRKRYTTQICSRLEGEFQTLPFAGRDIRTLKG